MATFIEMLFTGVMVGTIYGLVALGFVLIYKSSGVLNLAQGELLMIGAYVLWAFLYQLSVPIWLALPMLFLTMGSLGFGLERFPLRPLTGQPILSITMVTLAIALFLRSVTVAIWGSLPNLALPDLFPAAGIKFMGIGLSTDLLFAFGVSILLAGIFTLFFNYTQIGLNMRAVAEGHELVQSMGINVFFIIGMVWAISAVVSAAGGVLLGSMRSVNLGLSAMGLKALPAALIGGLDSVRGAFIGGIIVGVIESLAGRYIGYGIKEVAPFILLLIVIVVKPYGLYGLARIERI
jgi:branched-chain amino acid transport system permease protein